MRAETAALLADTDQVIAEYDRVRKHLDDVLQAADALLATRRCVVCGVPADTDECTPCVIAEDVAATRREDV